jgi:MFS family permease
VTAADQDLVAGPAIAARPAWLPLAVIASAQFLIALDYSIVYVALPSIAKDLRMDPATAQWVISAYAVLFAGLLAVGGRLSDRVGARRLFVCASLAFAVASAVGGAAGSGTMLLLARGTQGVAAALLQPAVLGLIGITFPAGPQRTRALAVWGSVGATGLVAGAVLGGLLTTASWRLTVLVAVPVAAACAFGALAWIPRDRARRGPGVPYLASALGSGAVLTLALGLTFAADRGWTAAATVDCLTAAAVIFAGFLVWERQSTNVLVSQALRRAGSIRIGAVATALYMTSAGSEFYLITLLMQSARGYSALAAGLGFVPLAAAITGGNALAGRAMRTTPATTVLWMSFLVLALGLVLLVIPSGNGSYSTDLLPGLVVSGLGHGGTYTAMFVVGTRDVGAGEQGAAGGLLTTSQYLAGSVAVAVFTLVLGRTPGGADFDWAFSCAAVAALLGAAVCAVYGSRTRGVRECPPGSA